MAVVETETLHGKFFKNAWNEPERVALICGEQKISYRDLRIYALQAANHLRQQGVKKGDKVVVILPRGIGQVVALLGILALEPRMFRSV
ncbi:MAG: AMP-binding protein [Lachnospiraceae bacterium]